MPGLTAIMDNGLSGLYLARVALQTVSHNIANVNTVGFSRQSVVMTAARAQEMSYGAVGRGVEIDRIRRMTDDFLLQKNREQNARLAGYAEIDANLSDIEAVFGSVTNDHLGTALTSFFNAWSDLASPPANSANKQAVVNAAQTLCSDFQATSASLTDIERNLNAGIEQELTGLNGMLRQFANLNGQILSAESQGGVANDLRDQRDNLVLEISKLTRVSQLERDDGTIDLVIKGRTVVTRGEYQQLELHSELTAAGATSRVTVAGTDYAVDLGEGKLAGMVASRDEHVRGVRAALDNLAKLVADKVNAIHVQGRAGSSRELAFFSGDSAATLAVNSQIVTDPGMVAASRSGQPGDNDIALEIAGLADAPIEPGGTESLLDRYNGLIVDLASRCDSSQFQLQAQQNIVDTVQSRVESVRGVSLDEESAELLRYQNAYAAAARVVTTAGDLFKTLLEMI